MFQAIEQGLVAGVPLLRDMSAWRAVLALMALPGAVLVLCLLTLREPARRPLAGDTSAQALPLRAVFADLRRHQAVLLPIYLGMALMTFGDAAMGNWLPALLSRKFGMGAAAIGQLYGGAVIVSASIGVFGGGLVADRLIAGGYVSTRAQISMWAALLALPGAFAGLGGSAYVVVFGYAWWALMSSAAAAVAITALPDLTPAHMRGVAIALASFGNIMIGTGGGTLATPWVNDQLFADPLRIGVAMTLVTVPAGVAALALFFRSWRASLAAGALARQAQLAQSAQLAPLEQQSPQSELATGLRPEPQDSVNI